MLTLVISCLSCQSKSGLSQNGQITVAASNASKKAKALADIVCDGKADQVEINRAISALPATGGKIQLTEGLFVISAPILISVNNTSLEGMGSGGNATILDPRGITTIKVANGANCNVLQNENSVEKSIYLSHFTIDGNKDNNYEGNGLQIDHLDLGGHYLMGLFDVRISRMAEDGIKGTVFPNFIFGSYIDCTNNRGDGIDIVPQGIHLATPNWFSGNTGDGLRILSGSDHWIEAYTETNAGVGAIFSGVQNSYIKIWAKSNSKEGIVFNTSPYNVVDVLCMSNQQGVGATFSTEVWIYDSKDSLITGRIEATIPNTDGIYFQGGNCSRTNIRAVIKTTRYGINFDTAGTPDYSSCVVEGSSFLTTTEGIFNNGADLTTAIIRGNTGYITENSGTAKITSANTSIVITHGLSITPLAQNINVKYLSDSTNDVGNWWVDGITLTQFTIHVKNYPGASGLSLGWSYP